MFNDFPDAELREVLQAARWRQEPADTTVICGRAAGSDLFVLAVGEAEVRVSGTRTGTLGKGECCGELAILAWDLRGAGVVTTDERTLLCIDSRLVACGHDVPAALQQDLRCARSPRASHAPACTWQMRSTHPPVAPEPLC